MPRSVKFDGSTRKANLLLSVMDTVTPVVCQLFDFKFRFKILIYARNNKAMSIHAKELVLHNQSSRHTHTEPFKERCNFKKTSAEFKDVSTCVKSRNAVIQYH